MSPAHHRYCFPIIANPSLCLYASVANQLLLLSAGSAPTIDFQPLSFHQLTSCFSSNSFVFTNICVAPCYFPLRTLCLPPQCPLCSDLSALCVTHFLSILLSSATCRLLALVFALPSFVFSSMQPLFQKPPGGATHFGHVDLSSQVTGH